MNRLVLYTLLNFLFIAMLTPLLLAIIPAGNTVLFRMSSILIIGIFNVLIYFKAHRLFRANHDKMKTSPFFLFVILCVGSALFFIRSYYEPHGQWDAWAMWNAKGRDYSLSFLQGLPFEIVRIDWSNANYPPFYPLQLAFVAIILGGVV